MEGVVEVVVVDGAGVVGLGHPNQQNLLRGRLLEDGVNTSILQASIISAEQLFNFSRI